MTAPLVFIDTETTGLDAADEIWEVAAIRREVNGDESYHHFQVAHDPRRCSQLPESFRKDHLDRFDWRNKLGHSEAAARIMDLFPKGTHLVAANPNFDTRFLSKLLVGAAPWHYHLIDVEAMALGYLYGRGWEPGEKGSDTESTLIPWKSDDMSRLCGVEPPTADRHTAQGDAAWVMRWFDEMVG